MSVNVGQIGSPPSTVTISEVRTNRDRNRFVRVPWLIYRNDPAWTPPLLLERKAFINPRKQPFYQHGTAALFIAEDAGQVVGRILVSDDPRYNEQHGTNAGCFGMFECIDDTAVAHSLLNAAADWLKKRGRTQILGPIDYSTNYACGLLIEGFDTPPRVMMNHNPPYYEQLLASWGLQKAKDLWAWWFRPNQQIEAWRPRVERLASRSGVVIRSFRRDQISAEIGRCKHLYLDSWRDNWGFVPMTDAEFEDMAQVLWYLAHPELLLVAEVDGQPVGFSITLPDFNEAIQNLDGRLTRFGLPIGLFKLRNNLKRIRTARLLALGVLEPYRRRGIAEMLVLKTFEVGILKFGYAGAELGWTLEDNDMINRTIASVGAEPYKTYRIYEKGI
ncbi:MAG: GNAT family N-acetyltransferase [Planctomycetota bacterium]|nr:GNAT family N-acetyltransferase [Planctomycetota bacterium]